MVMEEIYLDCQMIKRLSFGKKWIARPTVQVFHPFKKKPQNFLFTAFKWMATSFLIVSLKVETLIPKTITNNRSPVNPVLLELQFFFLETEQFSPEIPLPCREHCMFALLFLKSKWKGGRQLVKNLT